MNFPPDVRGFFGRHADADLYLQAIANWRPDTLATFRVRAPGDQFSVRIDSPENPDGNYLELFFDRELGPMMIFSRWHMTAHEAACARCPDDPVPREDQVAALLATADRLMRDELVLVIHDEGMEFRAAETVSVDALSRGDQVISWTGRKDFRKDQ